MIRLMLAALGGWAVWRYRNQIKEYLNRLPEIRTSATRALGEGTEKIKEGLQGAQDAIRSSPSAGTREGQRKP